MLKKSTLIPIIFIAVIGTVTICYAVISTNKNSGLTPQSIKALTFSGFSKDTRIELTHLKNQNITAHTITIGNNFSKTLDLDSISVLDLKISENSNIFDIKIRNKNNKISVLASGLSLSSKILLETGQNKLSKPIPVDWAGRITLNKNLSNDNFCILIQNKNDASICYRTQEVTS